MGVRIGFCTAVMNRRWQLEETLPRNLQALRGSRHFVAVCDYNSSDGISEWIRGFIDEVRGGNLVVFRANAPEAFHASVAKNTAHRLAIRHDADVLFNLDADNFISTTTVHLVESVFQSSADCFFHDWSPISEADGAFGRVAVSAKQWRGIGGYDERLLPIGWQDYDFLLRCRAHGLRYVQGDSGCVAPLPNSFLQRLENVPLFAETSGDEYKAWEIHARYLRNNLAQSMARPTILDERSQQTFDGILNFDTRMHL